MCRVPNLRWPWKDRGGQVIAEFALAAPLFFLFLAGTIELTGAVAAKASLRHAAQEGTRQAALAGSTEAGVLEVIRREMDLAGLDFSQATIHLSCDGAAGLCSEPGTTDQVEISYPYSTGLLAAASDAACQVYGCGGATPALLTLSVRAANDNE